MTIRADIVERPIDTSKLLEEVAAPGNGASILFIGTVRDVNDGRQVDGIEYASYASMAERELRAIAAEVAARHDVESLAVEHRIGTLALGDISVAIAAAHAHRAPAFAAARDVIEAIKQRVPIWKREQYVDGTREWIDPTRARTPVPAEDA